MTLQDILAQTYDIGRAAVIRSNYWDGSAPFLSGASHLGNTEGEFNVEPNEEFSTLTLPENLGPAPLKKYSTGAAPTFEMGIFYNPTQAAIFSPTGSASGGNTRQRRVREHTIWLVPEQLFLQADPVTGVEAEVDVTLSGGTWLKNSQPFTAEDTRLFNLSIFFWRVHFERAMPVYRHEDGGKSLRQVTVHAMPDTTKPDGYMIWTMGSDLAAAEIDLEGVSS